MSLQGWAVGYAIGIMINYDNIFSEYGMGITSTSTLNNYLYHKEKDLHYL